MTTDKRPVKIEEILSMCKTIASKYKRQDQYEDLVSDGMPRGDTLRIAMVHTGMNLLMAISLLPFVHHIAKYVGRFG